jgi:hypothetical protein
MRKLTSLVFLMCNFFLFPANVPACTIFVTTDGTSVWVGNNEDGPQNFQYRFWFYPSRKGNYGYMIWTELFRYKALNGLMYNFPQGGINDHGLFMDYTAIDEEPVTGGNEKQARKKQVVTDLLRQCKTVQEALEYINRYHLIKLKSAQLLIADAGGDYATVHGGYIVRKQQQAFALTNYCIKDGRKEACWRREVTAKYLAQPGYANLQGVTQLLNNAAQKSPNNTVTNYSLAINMATQELYVYHKGDFSTPVTILLKDELQKGKHNRNVADYFPKTASLLLEKVSKQKDSETAINQYKQYRLANNQEYNFKNNDALHTAINWIGEKRYNDAERLLNCLVEFEKENIDLQNWLGVIWRLKGDTAKSDFYFSKVLQQDPHNYLANLYGKQKNGRVIFKLKEFEAAETVELAGEFTNWRKNAIPLRYENGYWYAEVALPKGEVSYKFIINKQYEAEHINWLHGSTPNGSLVNRLFVW